MSDIKLSFDNVVVEGVDIKRVVKSYSRTNNNATKKAAKDTIKDLEYLDKMIEKFSVISDFENKYDLWKYTDRMDLIRSMNICKDLYQASCILRSALCHSYEDTKKNKKLTTSEIVTACNVYATEVLEKKLTTLQTELEKPFDQWLLHLTFSKYCWIEIEGAAAKKVYDTLLDEKKHTFVFKIDPNQVHDAEYLYRLTLKAIDAEEVL